MLTRMKNIEKITNNPEMKKRYTSPMIRFIELEECVMGAESPITSGGEGSGDQGGDGDPVKKGFRMLDDTESE